jgi:uncharacterized membrane protein YfcA
VQDVLAILSGSAVGFTLALIGGGGSILAVPLLLYVVGVASPHVAIGTGAVAVTANAVSGLFGHARESHVKWPCALVFAAAGIAGAALGAALGKAISGQMLLGAFGVLMILVGALMLVPRRGGDDPTVRLNAQSARRLLPALLAGGSAVGLLSGFFGIGGGFLIVPGLVQATRMPIVFAIGSSLVSVTAFGLTAAVSYAASGLVDWRVAGLFILGGVLGTLIGMRLHARLTADTKILTRIFAGFVIAAGLYVAVRAAMG